MGESIFILRGLNFIKFFDENSLSKQNSPRWDAAFCGVTYWASLLLLSHKRDARLTLVNNCYKITVCYESTTRVHRSLRTFFSFVMLCMKPSRQ